MLKPKNGETVVVALFTDYDGTISPINVTCEYLCGLRIWLIFAVPSKKRFSL